MGSPDRLGAERRRAVRLALRFAAEVHLPGEAPVRGRSIDISSNGVLLALTREIPLGKEVRVRIVLTDGQEPLEITAMAVRSQAAPGSGTARVAFHFIMPNEKDLRRISSLIYD